MRYILLAFAFFAMLPAVSTYAETDVKDESAYWQQKTIETQKKSTEMRKGYYDTFKAKWYDVSSITADLLDGSKTEEWKFWEALKKVQNIHEMADRKAYVEKYRSKGVDVSGFTDEVMNDSGKFWELIKKLQGAYEEKQKETSAKEKEAYMKEKEAKRVAEESKRTAEQEKKSQATVEKKTSSDDAKKSQTEATQKAKNTSNALVERAKKLFIERLDKIPEAEQAEAFAKLEKNIMRQLEVAKKRNTKILILKLEAFLQVLQERMDGDVDDESLVNSLF